jgi:hypothetical protein
VAGSTTLAIRAHLTNPPSPQGRRSKARCERETTWVEGRLPTKVYNIPSCSHPPSFLHHRIILLTTAQYDDKYLHPQCDLQRDRASVPLPRPADTTQAIDSRFINSGIPTSLQAAVSSPKLARSMIRIYHAHYGTVPDKSFENIAAGGITYHNG